MENRSKKKNSYWFKRYKHYANSLKRLTFASKVKYYEKYFKFNAHNSRKIWQGINEILRKKEKNTQ